MTAYLLDTNIWLRSVQREAPHHPIAVEALAALLAQGNDVFITAQNLIEFWSVVSQRNYALSRYFSQGDSWYTCLIPDTQRNAAPSPDQL